MKNITKYLVLVGVIAFGVACTSEIGLNIIRDILPFITHMLIVSGMSFIVLYGFLMVLDEEGTKKTFFNLNKIRKYLGAIGLMIFLLVCVSVSKQNTMEGILPYVIHMLIISGIIFMVLYTILMVLDGDHKKETIFRTAVLGLSFLIYYALIVADISISSFLIQTLENTNLTTIIMVNFIPPLVFGVTFAYFINKIFNNRNVMATKAIIMLSSLIIIFFVDTYASVILSIDTFEDISTAFSSTITSTKLLPHASFVLGLIVCVTFGYKNDISHKGIKKQYDNFSIN